MYQVVIYKTKEEKCWLQNHQLERRENTELGNQRLHENVAEEVWNQKGQVSNLLVLRLSSSITYAFQVKMEIRAVCVQAFYEPQRHISYYLSSSSLHFSEFRIRLIFIEQDTEFWSLENSKHIFLKDGNNSLIHLTY